MRKSKGKSVSLKEVTILLILARRLLCELDQSYRCKVGDAEYKITRFDIEIAKMIQKEAHG